MPALAAWWINVSDVDPPCSQRWHSHLTCVVLAHHPIIKIMDTGLGDCGSGPGACRPPAAMCLCPGRANGPHVWPATDTWVSLHPPPQRRVTPWSPLPPISLSQSGVPGCPNLARVTVIARCQEMCLISSVVVVAPLPAWWCTSNVPLSTRPATEAVTWACQNTSLAARDAQMADQATVLEEHWASVVDAGLMFIQRWFSIHHTGTASIW